ncbi:MAG: TonB-dependent receptor [Muribaculaceae bacterium]|nr:TonB-dependent receptor [Muribaculaceae bacterium]
MNNDTLVKRLREVSVTEKGTRKMKSTAPSYSVDFTKFESMGVTGVADALNRLPGVTLKDYGGAGGLKTVSVRGFGATHTNVLYDGVALSDCQNGEIDLSRYSLDNISSINLTIGDNDDIFVPARSASLAATLSLSTRSFSQHVDSTLLTARFRYGSFTTVSPYLKVGRSFSNGSSFDVSGEYLYGKNNYPFTIFNGKEITHTRRNNSQMNSGHVETNGTVKLGARTSLNGKLYYYDNNRHLPGPVVLYNETNNERIHDRNFFGHANLRSVVSSTVSVLANAKFNWAESRYSDRSGNYINGILRQNYFQRECYVSGTVLWMPVTSLALVYSADYIYNNLNSNLPGDCRPYRNSVLQTFTARYRVSRLTLTARGLLSIYKNGAKSGESVGNESKLSPSVSASYSILSDNSLTFRASYKNIFRMPTFNELYFDHLGSRTLKPESTEQFNAGLTYMIPTSGFISSLYITADGYYNNVNDKIVAIPYNLHMWRMLNLGKVASTGLDMTVASVLNVANGWQLIADGNYSFQNSVSRYDKESSDYGKQIAYTPVHSGSASLACENPFVNMVIHMTGASETFSTNNHVKGSSISGHVEAGVAVYRSIPTRKHHFELRFDLMNMFNKQYEIIARYPMPGRAWQATIKFTL